MEGLIMNHDDLLADLKRDEGLRLDLYSDTEGNLTGGYGHNFDDMGLSEAASLFILNEDKAIAIAELDRELPWWRNLPPLAQRGLANMSFNLGMPRLLKFRKMIAALKAGDFDAAATEALNSKWRRQVGDRAERIAALYRTATTQQG